MKRVAAFCIPAHGHTNPMLAVVAELVRRGDAVRFYSFREFEEKIRAAGAEFVACDEFLPPLTEREMAGLKRVSTTEMTLQDIRTTLRMDDFLDGEFKSFRPDVVYTDSVCFWGKLNAKKHGVPMVVSTSTFAFNQMSSQYMAQSPAEIADMVLGLPRVTRELKKLAPRGYHIRNALELVQSGNADDSVVYTSRRFQPYDRSFSDHYRFVGPSVASGAVPDKKKARPLVYISLGTVLNERPDFYRTCIEALGDEDADVVISCGQSVDPASLEPLPENVRVFPRVDQPEVLARADAFLTHCGMNSVSESLYMAVPMVLFPQTGEQKAVARRAAELGAGLLLTDPGAGGIRAAVRRVLDEPGFAEAAAACSADLRACPGPAGAADFIEGAPHPPCDDPLRRLNAAAGKAQLALWAAAAGVIALLWALGLGRFGWIAGLAAGLASGPLGRRAQERAYAAPEETAEP